MHKKKADLIGIIKPLALITHPLKDLSEPAWFKRLYKHCGLGEPEELCIGFGNLEISELFQIWNELLATQINRYNKASDLIGGSQQNDNIKEGKK